MDQLTEEQFEALKRIFISFDQLGDGTIPTKDLGRVMNTLGHHLTDEETEKMIKEVDPDDNFEIDFEEFCELIVKRNINI